MCAEKVEMGAVARMNGIMPIRQVYQTMRAAQARVDNRDIPLSVRIRSKETVTLCEERIAAETGQ